MNPGKYNDLATAFMSNQDETIKHIFSLGRLSRKYEVCKDDNCYFTLQTLFILTATYWVFMVLLGGIVIPGGLFMPSIMVSLSTQVPARTVLDQTKLLLAVLPKFCVQSPGERPAKELPTGSLSACPGAMAFSTR